MSVIIFKNGKLSHKYSHNSKQMTGDKQPGDLDAWDYFGTDPNELLTYSYGKLSARSTTLYHTHAPVAAAINKLTNYGIGPGLLFRSQPDWEILEITKEYAKDWGKRFQKLIHYVFKLLNFYEKQSILFRTGLVQGDSLLFFDRNSQENGLPFDLIETGGDQIDFLKSDPEKITLGIKHDKMLRRKGIVKLDGTSVDFKDSNGDQNVIQFYLKQIARQLRGYPLAYKVISASKNNDRWHDATLARMVVESMLIGYSNSDSGNIEDQASRLAAISKGQTGSSPTGLQQIGNIANAQPATMFSYGSQGGFQFADMKAPANNFDKVQQTHIEIVGMATDVPPECVKSMYSTSFTAHKGALNDFKISYMQKRAIFANGVVKPTIKEVAKYLFMSGLIEMPHPAFFSNAIIQEATVAGNYIGPVPGHINPAQEVQAKKTAVEEAFMLRSDAAAEYGNEFENMIEEWQEEEEKFNSQSLEKQAEELQQQFEKDKQQEQENDTQDNTQDESDSDNEDEKEQDEKEQDEQQED